MQVVVHLLLVGGDAVDALGAEGDDGLGEQSRGLQEVVCHNGHEDVQFEVALGSAHADSNVVADDLDRNHGDLLALGRVDFTGHDGGAGLVGRDDDLAEADAGAGSQPADVVGDLHHVACHRFDGAVGDHDLVLGGQSVELVLRGHEVLAGEGRDFLGDLDVEAFRSVEAGADSGAAEGQSLEGFDGELQELDVLLQGGAPAGDLLGEADRDSVLKMGTAGLDDALVLFLEAFELGDEVFRGGNEFVFDSQDSGDVHRGREGVVGGLGHVDVIVRMAEFLDTGDGVCSVRDDLVGVHVGLGARTGLPDDQREVVVELAGDDFVTGLGDGGQFLVGHLGGVQLVVGLRGGLLQDAERMGDLAGHGLDADADLKILVRTLRLGSPVFVCRDFHLAERVMFDSVLLFAHVDTTPFPILRI